MISLKRESRWEPPSTHRVKRKREDDRDDLSFRNHIRRHSRSLDRSYTGIHRNKSWKCQECFAIHEIHRICCTRSHSEVPEAQRQIRSSSVGAHSQSRSVRRCDIHPREREKRRDIDPPPKPEWPPQFEASGAAYVFDARSGFFYEAASDFFYDAKMKWYYGNKQRTYFTYVAGADPPFRPIALDAGTKKDDEKKSLSCPSAISGTTSSTTASKGCKAGKIKIAICLKKKSLGKTVTIATESGSVEAAPTAAAMEITCPSSPKPVETGPVPPLSGPSYTMADTPVQPPSLNPKEPPNATIVTTTTHGRPVCLLCKRKFADMEKLREHIELSALHKQNLKKATAMKS